MGRSEMWMPDASREVAEPMRSSSMRSRLQRMRPRLTPPGDRAEWACSQVAAPCWHARFVGSMISISQGVLPWSTVSANSAPDRSLVLDAVLHAVDCRLQRS